MKQMKTLVDFIQRSENGGAPLDNETAQEAGIDHGTPLVVMPKRQLLALLKLTLEGATKGYHDYTTAKAIGMLLKEHESSFIHPVSSKELWI